MLVALIGDISGSLFEWKPNKNKDFDLLTRIGGCCTTDDSVMTVAIANAILECNGNYNDLGEKAVFHMQSMGRNIHMQVMGDTSAAGLRASIPSRMGVLAMVLQI